MEKGFYHPDFGYWQTLSTPSNEILEQYPNGTVEIALKPGDGYEFDGINWIPPSLEWANNVASVKIRSERDYKLTTEVDPIVSNTLRWQEMSSEKQQEWVVYRRQLLDITLQDNFPTSVVWPIKPE